MDRNSPDGELIVADLYTYAGAIAIEEMGGEFNFYIGHASHFHSS